MSEPHSTDTYLVLDSPGHAEIRVKGSRFIAVTFSVDDVSEAEEALAQARKADRDATHHCSAWRIGRDGSTFRYSDDGEPNGSAGLPIFRQIEGRAVTNAMVVVVRYYGGTKLGTGGLVRAYGEAASLALDASLFKEIIPRTRVQVRYGYPDTSPAMHTIGRFDIVTAGTNYGDDTEMDLDVRTRDVDAFCAAFIEALAGRAEILR